MHIEGKRNWVPRDDHGTRRVQNSEGERQRSNEVANTPRNKRHSEVLGLSKLL